MQTEQHLTNNKQDGPVHAGSSMNRRKKELFMSLMTELFSKKKISAKNMKKLRRRLQEKQFKKNYAEFRCCHLEKILSKQKRC